MNDSFIDRLKDFAKIVLYPVSVYLFEYLHIDQEMIVILCILIGLDSFFGALKAFRIYHIFSTRTLIWGVVLKIMTLFIPTTVALITKGLGFESAKMFVSTVIGIMIVAEGYSIFANMYAARKKIDIQKIDAISLLLSSLRKWMYKLFQIGLKEIEKDVGCQGLQDREDDDIEDHKKQL